MKNSYRPLCVFLELYRTAPSLLARKVWLVLIGILLGAFDVAEARDTRVGFSAGFSRSDLALEGHSEATAAPASVFGDIGGARVRFGIELGSNLWAPYAFTLENRSGVEQAREEFRQHHWGGYVLLRPLGIRSVTPFAKFGAQYNSGDRSVSFSDESGLELADQDTDLVLRAGYYLSGGVGITERFELEFRHSEFDVEVDGLSATEATSQELRLSFLFPLGSGR